LDFFLSKKKFTAGKKPAKGIAKKGTNFMYLEYLAKGLPTALVAFIVDNFE